MSENYTFRLDEAVLNNVLDGMGGVPAGQTWEAHVEEARNTIRGWDNVELLEAIHYAMAGR